MLIKLLLKNATLLLMGGIMIANAAAKAESLRTPEGNMPMVHWAVLESTPGDMQTMSGIAAKTVGPQAAKESGTYALYGGVDASNQDKMRLLEIYESYEAYRIHSSSEAFQEYRAARLPYLKSLKILEVNGIALEQKKEGVGSVVLMRRYEVDPRRLLEFQHLAKAEAIRAVREEDGVLGMFVTAEHDAPNIIHTMEIYRDKASYDEYAASQENLTFQKNTEPMFLNVHVVENAPTRITLSDKGLRSDE